MIISQNVNNKLFNLKLDMVTRQELDYENLADCTPISEIKDNLSEALRDKLTKSEIKVLDYLFGVTAKHKIRYPSQDEIAIAVNCSRKTVIRAVKKLKSLGIVSVLYRPNATCLYKISSLFSNFYNLHSIKNIFKNVRKNIIKLSLLLLPLTLLTSRFNSSFPENVSQLNKSINFINNSNLDYLSNVQKNQLGGSVLNKNLKENKTTYKNLENVIESELGLWENSDNKTLENQLQVANKLSRYNMDDIVKRISERLSLNFDEIERLRQFPKSVLLKSEYRFVNTKENVSSPIPYFFGICYKIQRLENSRNFGSDNKTKSYNSSMPQISVEQKKAQEEKLFKQREEERERNKKSWQVSRDQANELMKKALDNPNDYWRNLGMEILNKNLIIVEK
jgi:DNA-binding Lrp family transcriptional regulator